MRIEPKLIDARTEPRLNDNNLVLWLNDNGKTNSMWRDYSGRNNHGTVYGAGTPPAATPGALGYTFDGVDDYVDVGNLIQSDYITISAWINTAGLPFPSWTFVVANYDGVDRSFELQGVTSESFLRLVLDTTTGADSLLSSVIQPSVWTYVVTTFDGTTMNFYLNGQSDTSKTHTFPGVINKPGNSLYIGWRPAKDHSSWNGIIDEVRIYNRALSSSEISKLFNATRGKFGV